MTSRMRRSGRSSDCAASGAARARSANAERRIGFMGTENATGSRVLATRGVLLLRRADARGTRVPVSVPHNSCAPPSATRGGAAAPFLRSADPMPPGLLPAASDAPALALALFAYAFISNVALAVVPHEPAIVWAGARLGIWTTAVIATAGTVLASWVDHRVFVLLLVPLFPTLRMLLWPRHDVK